MAEPAVTDTNWLEPTRLYLATGTDCELDRPVYQGDVFSDVALPRLPNDPPSSGAHPIDFTLSLCMVVPHPCQCYHGDSLRPRLTVAPVRMVENYENFGPERDKAFDKFALPGLPPHREGDPSDFIADFGRLLTVSSRWLRPASRVANLSHHGLGLLAKRVLRFQIRYPITLVNAMGYTAGEWSEAFLMQAWIRRQRTLNGFSDWLRTARVVPGVNGGEPVRPYDVRAGALDSLLELITGEAVVESE